MKRKYPIIVVECISSSVNYINDIRKAGYEPIALEVYVPEEKKMDSRALHDLYFSLMDTDKPEILEAAEEYEDTLAMVRKLEPVLVIPGGDDGIDLATRLSSDLGLVGNDPVNLPKMRDKWYMQNALKDAGIRYIHSKIIKNCDEALKFYGEQENGYAVLKPVVGGATVGVHVCATECEVKAAMADNMKMSGGHTDSKGRIMIQEYIEGDEYIVNSVSSNGYHMITSVYKYKKTIVPGFGPKYDNCINLSPSSPDTFQLCEYAVNVLNAIGFENGAVHAEYKVDKCGPVLIEVNCRLCGAMMKSSWLDMFLPHHETDIVLASLLHPERFTALAKGTIEPIGYGMIALTYLNEDTFVYENRQKELFSHLKSFVYESNPGNNRIYPRTVDLSTMGGMIYLSSKDKHQLLADYEYIRKTNDNTPEQIFIRKK